MIGAKSGGYSAKQGKDAGLDGCHAPVLKLDTVKINASDVFWLRTDLVGMCSTDLSF